MKRLYGVIAIMAVMATVAGAWETDVLDTLKNGKLDVAGGLYIDGTEVTATAAELNIMDGVTATAAELNALDGISSDVNELNTLDASVMAVFMDDFFSAGYIAAAATIGTNATTILQGGKFSEVADHAQWLVTVTDGDSDNAETIVVADDAPGGVLVLTCNNKAVDSLSLQMNGESFSAASGDVWFDARVSVEDADKDTVFVGLTTADTDLDSLANDSIGFLCKSTETNWWFYMSKNGTAVSNSVGIVRDGTVSTNFRRLGFYLDASTTNAYVYIDGVLTVTRAASASLPNDEALTPSLYIETSDTGSDALYVDYVKVIQGR